MMGIPGGWELAIIALFVVLVFGAKKIPEIMKGVGQGVRELRQINNDINKGLK